MAKRRFELVEGSSSKFWEIGADGATVTVSFGKIGTGGNAKDKTHASADAAAREVEKLIAEKTKKGYAEVGASPPVKKSAAAAAPSKPAASPLVDAFFTASVGKRGAFVYAGGRLFFVKNFTSRASTPFLFA